MRFTIDERSVRYRSAAARDWVIDPGTFDVRVGASSAATEHATFEVEGPMRP
ncbi:MAG: fibronectin type III-like domain-contianing protein [Sphingomonas fennica]